MDANPTISSTVFRSGAYSLQVTSLSSGTSKGLRYTFQSSASDGPFYFRIYFRVDTLPSAANTFWTLNNGTVGLKLNSTGTLQLFDEDSDIGTASSILSTGSQYRIEILVDRTPAVGRHVITARLDGNEFATSSARTLSTGVSTMQCGGNILGESQTTGNWFFDDIAINDSTGSFQNSWPGEGEIIHLRPNAAGDNAGWTDGTGSTFAEIDEVTPDDVTTYLDSNSNGEVADYNIDDTPAALASDDAINVVQVGVRYRNQGTSAGNTFKLRIKASAGGTLEESAQIALTTNTTWHTNANAVPRNYVFTLYDLPGASTTPWAKANLDAAQIGVNHDSGTGTSDPNVSTLWLLVDHKPAGAETTTSTSSSTSTSSTTTSSSTSSTTTSSSTSTTSSTSTSSTTTSSSTSTTTSTTTSSTTTSSSTTSSTSTSSTTTSSSTTSSTSTSTSSTTTSSSTSSTTSTSTSSTTTSSSTTVSETTTSTSTSSTTTSSSTSTSSTTTSSSTSSTTTSSSSSTSSTTTSSSTSSTTTSSSTSTSSTTTSSSTSSSTSSTTTSSSTSTTTTSTSSSSSTSTSTTTTSTSSTTTSSSTSTTQSTTTSTTTTSTSTTTTSTSTTSSTSSSTSTTPFILANSLDIDEEPMHVEVEQPVLGLNVEDEKLVLETRSVEASDTTTADFTEWDDADVAWDDADSNWIGGETYESSDEKPTFDLEG